MRRSEALAQQIFLPFSHNLVAQTQERPHLLQITSSMESGKNSHHNFLDGELNKKDGLTKRRLLSLDICISDVSARWRTPQIHIFRWLVQTRVKVYKISQTLLLVLYQLTNN